jgi:hypothetical protein
MKNFSIMFMFFLSFLLHFRCVEKQAGDRCRKFFHTSTSSVVFPLSSSTFFATAIFSFLEWRATSIELEEKKNSFIRLKKRRLLKSYCCEECLLAWCDHCIRQKATRTHHNDKSQVRENKKSFFIMFRYLFNVYNVSRLFHFLELC